MEYSIQLLQDRIKKKDKDILLWCVLSDYYCEVAEFALSLTASQKAADIKPFDARALYTLATAYNVFTWPRFIDHPNLVEIPDPLAQLGVTRESLIKCRQELQQLNMTVEGAAEQAIRCFQLVLKTPLSKIEREQVLYSLAVLCHVFPQFAFDSHS